MAQINKPTDYFNTKLYTGNGSTQSITGVGFQPDWTWIKGRSVAYGHSVYDVIRGAGYRLEPNTTNGEGTYTSFVSFDSDGFSLGSGAAVNENTQTFASWNWLASNTTASNTDGSITTTISANQTSGFSIISYTGNATSGATIGHGLNAVPKIIFVKKRDNTVENWAVGIQEITGVSNDSLWLNLTNGSSAVSSWWNSTSPTTSLITLGNGGGVNDNGSDYIAYCFADVKGFSKFGSYTGNGSTDGTFVYTGFKPAFVMIKRSSDTEGWWMQDNKRTGFNPSNDRLEANASGAESDLNSIDILSNGFKCRQTYNGINASGSTYIYMAFAESPLVGTNNTPATAR